LTTTVNLADELRRPLIELVVPVLEALVLTPAAAPTDPQRAALHAIVDAHGLLTNAITRSSSPTYAVRDLPGEERALVEKARHLLGVLDRLHGPQAMP
jgi:hypothetical protein